MFRGILNFVLLLVVLIGLAGCEATSPTRSDDGAGVEDRSTMGTDDGLDSAVTRGTGDRSSFSGSPLADPNSPLSKRTIYFDFDSTTVKPEYQEVLRAHAGFLARNPSLSLTMQGHADERGSREYNLALGDRRAVAVKRLAVLLGAGSGQISAMSYGEEKPVAYGHDESSWQLNRRVELVY